MAELRSLFLEIYIFILCVNAGIFVLDSVDPTTSLLSPFSSEEVSTSIPSDIAGLGITNSTNASGTLVAGVGTSVVNGTGSSSILDPIQDSVFFPFAVFETFINFLTGGFIWNTLGMFGMPIAFVIAMQSIIGFLLVITIIYYFTGR